jgi:hypothetical protein
LRKLPAGRSKREYEPFDCSRSLQHATGGNGEQLKSIAAIDFLVNPLETEGRFKIDAASFGRDDEAEILYEEDALLINRFRLDALQFAGKRRGERVSEEDRQRSGADCRPVVKLDIVRLVRRSHLPPFLQINDRIDERGIFPRFGDAARVLQSMNVGCRFLYDTEAIELQLPNNRLPRFRGLLSG